MFRLKPAARLSLTIGFVCLSVLLVALGLNLIPDPAGKRLEHRLSLVRAFAASISTLAETNRTKEIQLLMARSLAVEPSLRSMALRREGRAILSDGDHEKHWVADAHPDQVSIGIFSKSKIWGTLEVAFHSDQRHGLGRMLAFPVPLMMFLFSSVSLVSWYVLSKTFYYLNPSNVVPDRVRNALDSICSGLAMITPEGEIAHSNKAFNRIVQTEPEDIVGKHIDHFQWSVEIDFQRELPWNRSRKFRESVAGEIVQAKFNAGVVQKYMVSATPIFANSNQFRGVLVSFEDVTALEAKKSELAKVIQSMRLSRDEVQRQNEQLHFLANFDPLTRCMNRRSFYTEYEKLWHQPAEHPLTLLILDIDFFKKINDGHGHSAGDEVLKAIGSLLNSVVGNQGAVCRFGGEEFTILLPDIEFDAAVLLAERVRATVEEQPIAGLQITTSIGASNKSLGAMDGQHMLDQADECLYAAKRNGRNQVVRYDRIHEYESRTIPELPENTEVKSQVGTGSADDRAKANSLEGNAVEYSSVTGLLSALSFRSRTTAEHSIRVADLAVDLGRSLLTSQQVYFLEIAGLLHDVGKIGVPDNILNKPSRLTDEEWEIMRRHDEIGVAIVRSAFASSEVGNIIENYYQIKSGQKGIEGSPQEPLNLCAQILYLCDAFDSMLAGAIYRPAITVSQALEEILCNTPQQFHPPVVNELVEFIRSGRLNNRRYVPQDTADSNPRELNRLTDEIENAQSDSELDGIVKLADEVMALYYDTRSALNPQSPPLPKPSTLSP